MKSGGMDMALFGNALVVNDLLTLQAGAYVSEFAPLSADQVLTDEYDPIPTQLTEMLGHFSSCGLLPCAQWTNDNGCF
jgi:hypothetical protein